MCNNDKDDIIGLINTKDLCFNESLSMTIGDKNSIIKNNLRKIMFVTEMTPIDEILKRMQKNKIHLGIVVDEYGGTSGLLSIEDILEEIVGEIQDEYDEERKPIEKTADHTFSVDAQIPISDINMEFNLNLEARGVFTLGGWFIEISHQRPEIGQAVSHRNVKFTIEELEHNTIRRISIKLDTDKSTKGT